MFVPHCLKHKQQMRADRTNIRDFALWENDMLSGLRAEVLGSVYAHRTGSFYGTCARSGFGVRERDLESLPNLVVVLQRGRAPYFSASVLRSAIHTSFRAKVLQSLNLQEPGVGGELQLRGRNGPSDPHDIRVVHAGIAAEAEFRM